MQISRAQRSQLICAAGGLEFTRLEKVLKLSEAEHSPLSTTRAGPPSSSTGGTFHVDEERAVYGSWDMPWDYDEAEDWAGHVDHYVEDYGYYGGADDETYDFDVEVDHDDMAEDSLQFYSALSAETAEDDEELHSAIDADAQAYVTWLGTRKQLSNLRKAQGFLPVAAPKATSPRRRKGEGKSRKKGSSKGAPFGKRPGLSFGPTFRKGKAPSKKASGMPGLGPPVGKGPRPTGGKPFGKRGQPAPIQPLPQPSYLASSEAEGTTSTMPSSSPTPPASQHGNFFAFAFMVFALPSAWANIALLTIEAGLALVDSGCSRSMIGEANIAALLAALKTACGGVLEAVRFEVPTTNFGGIGSGVTSLYGLYLPVQFGKARGWLELVVVTGQAPLLLSNEALNKLGAIQDHRRHRLWIPAAGE